MSLMIGFVRLCGGGCFQLNLPLSAARRRHFSEGLPGRIWESEQPKTKPNDAETSADINPDTDGMNRIPNAI